MGPFLPVPRKQLSVANSQAVFTAEGRESAVGTPGRLSMGQNYGWPSKTCKELLLLFIKQGVGA